MVQKVWKVIKYAIGAFLCLFGFAGLFAGPFWAGLLMIFIGLCFFTDWKQAKIDADKMEVEKKLKKELEKQELKAKNNIQVENNTQNNKTKPDDKKKRRPIIGFTKAYFDELNKIADEMITILTQVLTETTIMEKFGSNPSFGTAKDTLYYCLLVDLCTIAKRLDTPNRRLGFHKAGLVVVGKKLNAISTTFLQMDNYNQANVLYMNKSLEKAYAQMIGFYQGSMFNFDMEVTKDNKSPNKTHFEVLLNFATALKLFQSPTFPSYSSLLVRFAELLANVDGPMDKAKGEALALLVANANNPLPENIEKAIQEAMEDEKDQTLENILAELDALVGLDDVKQSIKSMVNFLNVQKVRETEGLKSSNINKHLVFTGNPGTGKTTVARIVAHIYKSLGILKQGQLIETDRSGLVGEYVGHTAIKVNKVVDSALNGILFIDEAYSLTTGIQDFGAEAVATLIKRMEDDRDRLVVIVAGYTKDMERFIQSNPGLQSRFNQYVHFPDYTPQELFEIFERLSHKMDYTLSTGAKEKLVQLFKNAYLNRDKSFGNGRFVRNVFEKAIQCQANRIAASKTTLDKSTLLELVENDIVDIV